MQWVKKASLTVYFPVPADPDQLTERSNKLWQVHTAALKGKNCGGRWAHIELENVLYLVKWYLFLCCCGTFCFACVFCGFSYVPPNLLSWKTGSLVMLACALMLQNISCGPHISSGLSVLCHRGALQAVAHPTPCPQHGGSHRYCFALTTKNQHRKLKGRNKLIWPTWLPLCFL